MLKKPPTFVLIISVFILLLNSCSSTRSVEEPIRDSEWRVKMQVNGYTTKETSLVSWYYKAAKLALDKGYDGFEDNFSGGVPIDLHKPPIIETLKSSSRLLNDYDGFSITRNIRLINKPFKMNSKYAIPLDAHKIVEILSPWMNKKCSSARSICLDGYKTLYNYVIQECKVIGSYSCQTHR